MTKSDLKLDDIWDTDDDLSVKDLRSVLPALSSQAASIPPTPNKRPPLLPQLKVGSDIIESSPRKSSYGYGSSPSSPKLMNGSVPRSRVLSRSRTLPRISPSESNRMRRTRSEIEGLEVDAAVLNNIRRWILAIAIVEFDLDDGPVVDAVFPPIHLSSQEASNIAFSAFPDSLQFDQGSQNHSFCVRECPNKERDQTTSDGFIYGHSHFTQRRNPHSKRGYEQRSVVILTHLAYPALFTSISSVFGPLFESHGVPMLESACHNIATWPDPSPGMTLELGFLGSVLHLELPRTIDSQQLTDTSSFKEKYNPKLHILASAPPFAPPPLLLFEACLSHLWSIWECVVLGEPILIFGASPVETSQAVWWFRDLLRPIPFAGDIRPYFTIHDQDNSLLVNKLPPKSGLLLGVTNPFFHRSCSHWPHILSLGRKLQHSAGISGKNSHKLAAAGPEPGWKTSVHKRYISKDRALLKQLEDACRGTDQQKLDFSLILRRHFCSRTNELLLPLTRYLNTLIPTPTEVASEASPRLKPFNNANFFASLRAHGTPLPFKSTSKRTEFYERWLKTPAFGLWLAQQERIVQGVLEARAS
ncbi:family with sequence similarity member b [Moniliophthora roreri MCA 2997]|uniref:Family with sequence similarity member b n=1 Tax=Moniliophthora roreri (strain MCA 2997) TaxID=1381753 RepID=V2XSM0_MONRO|nr:family with sequence similarity member b [Moniliophthora roreri MCA 2997]